MMEKFGGTKKLKGLPHPDDKLLEAAEGWLGLGNWLEANEELENIAPLLKGHPYVLEVRYKIYEAAGRWEMAAGIAEAMRDMLPDNPWGHFHLAYSLHELNRTQAAYDTLIPVMGKFPKEWLMRYNLACYACRLGNLKESWQWLEKAFDMGDPKQVKLMALDDPDLEKLWAEIEEI